MPIGPFSFPRVRFRMRPRGRTIAAFCASLFVMSGAPAAEAQSDFGERLGSFRVALNDGSGGVHEGDAFISVQGRGCTQLVVVTELHSEASFGQLREGDPVFQVDPLPYLAERGIDPSPCGHEFRLLMVAREAGGRRILGRHGYGRWANPKLFGIWMESARTDIAALPPHDPDLVWNHIDANTLPWQSHGFNEFVALGDIPGLDRIPVHPEYGRLTGILGQSDLQDVPYADEAIARYGRARNDQCVYLQTLYQPEVFGENFQRFYGDAKFLAINRNTLASATPAFTDWLGLDMDRCSDYANLTRVVTPYGQFYRFHVDGQPVDEAAFQSYLDGTREEPQEPLELPPLPGGLINASDWMAFYHGRFDAGGGRDLADYLIGAYAYSTIVVAHSNRVNNRNGSCAYPNDRSRVIDRGAYGNLASGEATIHHPESHRRAFNRMLRETRLEMMFMRGYMADAEKIVAADGCAGPRVWLLRENLWRFIEREAPLSRDMVERTLQRFSP